tara:strand:+ start:627 stop:1547 length:921 start_codon:yes stop_codon:yes gene_type:complete
MNFDQTGKSEVNNPIPIDLTNENFVQEVIEKSKSIPVIVDFWAPWCEPCKQIGPILDRLVSASNGRVILTKMNIEDYPEISQQLQIQSIPAILGFHNGQPVDGFVGVQPESAIKSFVEKLANLNGPSDNDVAIEQGKTLYSEKNYNEALEIFGKIAQSEPDNVTALSMVANCYLKLNEIDIAKEIISNIENPDKEKNQDYISAKSQIDIFEKSEDSNIDDEEINKLEKELESKPNNHQLRYEVALGFMSKGKYDQAMSHLLTIIEKDRMWNDEAPRKSLLEIFNALGPADELATEGRKKLSSILFS